MSQNPMAVYAEQQRRREQDFLTLRIKEEQDVQRWVNDCLKLPDEIKSQFPIDLTTFNIRDYIPEWYKEEMSQAVASEQVRKLNELIEQCDAVILSYNDKAIQLMGDMNTLMGGATNGNSGI